MSIFKVLISTIRFSRSERFEVYNKTELIHIYIYYLMYEHLYNMTLNISFLLSVSTYFAQGSVMELKV